MSDFPTEKAEVLAIMPPTADDFDFETIDCCPSGPEVSVVDDFELLIEGGAPVLEVLGEKSEMAFYMNTNLPHVALHIKSIARFMAISLQLVDDLGKERTVHFSNKRSIVTVDQDKCSLPIGIGMEGWQYLNLDFERICKNAFGTHYKSCLSVTVHGSCRLSKLFFQQREYADVELPEFLRVCVPEN
jgi:hypothetical protein